MPLSDEDVWEYPRPPRLERVEDVLSVVLGGVEIARTERGWRVLETGHPPSYYFPPSDVLADVLAPAPGSSLCEWKGRARYFDAAVGGHRALRSAWSYPDPTPAFAAIRGHFAFYARAMDLCRVGAMPVVPQEGEFYGGWITPNLRGPFKLTPARAAERRRAGRDP